MSYQRLRCPRGHAFRAYVTSKFSRVECPDCQSAATRTDNASQSVSTTPDPVFTFDAGSCWPASSSPEPERFASGGGGDYGGGGASSSWESSSSDSSSSSSSDSYSSSDSSSSSSSSSSD